jgi:PIN domain nuclease of toxin-antitoxin system
LVKASVFDSSAVLAAIFSEPGAERVVDLLDGGLLSTVNLTEIHTRLLVDGRSPERAWNSIGTLGLYLCTFDDAQARTAAEMISITKPFGLSLGDRACFALAIERNAKVYTTDKAWKNLSLGVEVEVIR